MTARHTSTQISSVDIQPCRLEPGNYGAFGVRKRMQMARPCHFPPLAHLLVAFPNSCAYWRIAPCVPGPVVMTSKSAGLSVRCTSPWVWLPGGTVHCVSRGIKHYTSPVFTEQFHPACMRGGLSSEPCLAFKCGKSAQSPPLTRNAARLSSWCSLNKLNNEGISEMPKRHYTPTIRARSE